MDITHVAFEGGSKDGTTDKYEIAPDLNLHFDSPFEPEETYERTTDTITISGVQHVVFRLKV